MREWLVGEDQREAVLGARYRRDHLLDDSVGTEDEGLLDEPDPFVVEDPGARAFVWVDDAQFVHRRRDLLLETAVQNDVNVFFYMEYLLAHQDDVIANPRNYLPWIYKLSIEEKKEYWANVDHFMKAPSSFSEYLVDVHFRSLA